MRLRDFVRLLSHRGPDDSGEWIDESAGVGLAHTRLSIIDLSPAGHQPMWDSTGKVGIVFNGEIYNYRELRGPLEAAGYPFASHSDTEVIIAGYVTHGIEFIRKLNGIFAFALWDARLKQLLVVRDPFGVKPLYYAQGSQGFVFASEMKALVATSAIARDLDPSAVFSHLTFLWSPGAATMLRSVRKLEAGCAMAVSDGKITRAWRYYDLPIPAQESRISADEASVQVVEALGQAVERQMVADVPVGAFLSGGLDSTSIVHFARRHATARRLQCFSIAFRDKDFEREGFADDLPYAKAAARHLDVDLEVVEVGPEVAHGVERMVYQLDEPQADPAAIHVGLIAGLARQYGIKVLLAGTGGDDLFTGYRRHLAVNMERYWGWMPRGVLKMMAAASTKGIPDNAPPVLRRIRRGLEHAHLSEGPRIASFFYWMNPVHTERLLAPSLRPAFRAFLDDNPLMASLRELPAELPSLSKMLYLEQRYFLTDHNLNYTDKMGMAHGVEIRVPFLDPDLVTLAANLPLALKQRGRTGKWILRKAMEPYLPASIIHRSKTGFGAPVHSWLKSELKELLCDVLTPDALRSRGLFDPLEVSRLVSGNQPRSVHSSYTLFAILCIELWCRSFVDGGIPPR